VNFACSSHARGFDISQFLVFATDTETYELAHAMGMTAFFDEKVRPFFGTLVLQTNQALLYFSPK